MRFVSDGRRQSPQGSAAMPTVFQLGERAFAANGPRFEKEKRFGRLDSAGEFGSRSSVWVFRGRHAKDASGWRKGINIEKSAVWRRR